MQNDLAIHRYTSAGGTVVYKLPVEAFRNHFTNCYLVLTDPVTLIDAASGWEDSNRSLESCFDLLRVEFGESIGLTDVRLLILTHGHIDHFGGLHFVADHAPVEIAIHALDASVVRHFNERLIVTTTSLHVFLTRAGLPPDDVKRILAMNKWSKDLFRATDVHRTFEEGPLAGTPFEVYHTPGHCPGQVCLRLDDILFTADHLLSHITPTQSPESITRYTGLGHYFESLKKVRGLEGMRIGLGGHERAIEDIQARVDETLAFHETRLEKTWGLCREPHTVGEVAMGLFGQRKDYHELLALLETGAHVEYLYDRGRLVVTNADEVDDHPNPVLLYRQA
jgi:glyoxylase-like metal-dependent hydrolase (beta-lactamase superfamily II)